MDAELEKTLKHLRLGGMLTHWDEYMVLARKKQFSPVKLLQHVLQEEYRIKQENARTYRTRRARIPETYVMETFPFSEQPKLNKKKILSIYDAFDYVDKAQNIIWVGPTGCGKTGLATSFLLQAINHGHKGRYVLFPELIDELFTSVADHSEAKVMKHYQSYDCLLIVEIGHVEIEPVQAGLFFTLMHKRHRKKTTLITSNLGFSEWRGFLKNDHLTAALIDRLTENSHVINMRKCVSLRPKLQQ